MNSSGQAHPGALAPQPAGGAASAGGGANSDSRFLPGGFSAPGGTRGEGSSTSQQKLSATPKMSMGDSSSVTEGNMMALNDYANLGFTSKGDTSNVSAPFGRGANGTSKATGSESAAASGGLNGQVPPPFLTKLYELVEDTGTNDLVSWEADGRVFTVHKTTRFARDVLPRYFKHNKFQSFVRQLNQYGFHKQDPDRWTFGHENFRRGRRDLLADITRRKSKVNVGSGDLTQFVPPKDALMNQKLILELGNYGILGEVEVLRRDKDMLMKELMNTRKEEGKLKRKCEAHESRIKHLENGMKKMQQFLYLYFQPVLNNYTHAKSKRKRLPPADSPVDENDRVTYADSNSRPALPLDSDPVMLQRVMNHLVNNSSTPRLGQRTSPSFGRDAGGFSSESPFSTSQPSPSSYPPAYVQELSNTEGSTKSNRGKEGSEQPPRSKRRRGSEDNNKMDGSDAASNAAATAGNTADDEILDDNAQERAPPPTRSASGQHTMVNPAYNGFETYFDAADQASYDSNPPDGQDGADVNALDDFLNMEGDTIDENALQQFPPLNALPNGTDLDAFARQMEDFQDVTY